MINVLNSSEQDKSCNISPIKSIDKPINELLETTQFVGIFLYDLFRRNGINCHQYFRIHSGSILSRADV